MFTTRIFDEMDQFRRSFDRLFENLAETAPHATATSGNEWTFTPAVETGWTDDHLNLRFVLPAVKEKDLEVTVQGNQLYIRGERRPPEGFGKESQVYFRLPYGRFERTVDLPAGLNSEKLEAYLHDGVLDVRIPVAAEMKPKKIQITPGKEPQVIAA